MTEEEIFHMLNDNENAVFDLYGPTVDYLPDGLSGSSLILTDCPNLTRLPENMNFMYLAIDRCPALTSLPENLEVEILTIYDSPIASIPDSIQGLMGCTLHDCPNLTKLPESFHTSTHDVNIINCHNLTSIPFRWIYASLDISGTPITRLHKDLRIGDEFIAHGSALKEMPRIAIGKSVDLSDSRQLRSLPDDWVVNGDLNLSGTAVTHLPKRLIVGGDLNLSGTAVTHLPSDLIVKGKIISDRLPEKSIRQLPFPIDLSRYIWHGCGYIYSDGDLYKILNPKDFVWLIANLFFFPDAQDNLNLGPVAFCEPDFQTFPFYRYFFISDHCDILMNSYKPYYHLLTPWEFDGEGCFSTLANRKEPFYWNEFTPLSYSTAIEAYCLLTDCSPDEIAPLLDNAPGGKKDTYQVGEIIRLTQKHKDNRRFRMFFEQ